MVARAAASTKDRKTNGDIKMWNRE